MNFLIICEAHLKTKHGGVKDTLLEIHSQYWLIQSRQAVKYLIRRCVLCQRLESKSFPKQIANNLPASRVTCSFAFESDDVDYFRPINVKQVYNEYDDPSLFKAEIVLCTCPATSAVHLDLVLVDVLHSKLKKFYTSTWNSKIIYIRQWS